MFRFYLLITLYQLHQVFAQYDDSFTRNKFFPMASTAYGMNPASCVAKIFPDSQVKIQFQDFLDLSRFYQNVLFFRFS
jgi:hypothetical protein